MKLFNRIMSRSLIGATLAALVITTMAGCSGGTAKSGASPGSGGTRQQRQMPVSTQTVKLSDVGGGLVFTGSVVPVYTTNVSSRIAGRVAELFVKVGDRVEVGQPLARIDTTALQQDYDKQQATLAVNEAQYQAAVFTQGNGTSKADRDYAVQQAQYEKTVTDQQNAVEIAKQAVALSQAQLNSAIQTQQNQIAAAKQAVASAQASLNKAINDTAVALQSAQNNFSYQADNLQALQNNTIDDLKAALRQAIAAYQNSDNDQALLSKVEQAQAALDRAQESPLGNKDLASALKAYNDAQTALQNAQNSQAVQIAQETLNEKLLALANAQAATPDKEQQQLRRDQLALSNAQAALETQMNVAKAQLEQQEAALKTAQAVSAAQLELARTNLRITAEQLKEGVLNSPVSGIVTAIGTPVGQNAGSQSTVATIATVEPTLVTVNVSEANIGKMKVGMPMAVKVPTLDKSFEGKIAAVRPVLDSVTKSYGVDIEVNDPKQELLPGMFAVSSLQNEGRQAIMVPADAVVSQPSGNAVFIVKDGRAQKVLVKTGTLTSAQIEIVSGLKEGDELVVRGQELLSDNVPVQVVQPSADQRSYQGEQSQGGAQRQRNGERQGSRPSGGGASAAPTGGNGAEQPAQGAGGQ